MNIPEACCLSLIFVSC